MTDVVQTISALKARERALREETVADPDAQLQALRDAVAALGTAGIATALIGGIAVGVRSGRPRATLDVDLAARVATSRARIVSALADAGFTHRGSYPHSENFRHRNSEPVQVALDAAFDVFLDRAEPVDIGETTVRVVTIGDLIAMKKRAAADPSRRRSKALRDLADVALLEGDVGEIDEGW